jgi:hypothetical protein
MSEATTEIDRIADVIPSRGIVPVVRHTRCGYHSRMTEEPERRDPVRRAAFVQSVVTHIIQGPLSEFTVETLQHLLNTSPEIADRILHRLSSVGLLQEKRHGVWVRVTPTTPSPVII